MRDMYFPCFGTGCLGKEAPGDPESRPVDNVTFNFDLSTSDVRRAEKTALKDGQAELGLVGSPTGRSYKQGQRSASQSPPGRLALKYWSPGCHADYFRVNFNVDKMT